MIPQFPVFAGRIIPQIEIFIEALGSILRLPVRPVDERCISHIDEFCGIAWAQEGMINDHSLGFP